ncbi:MAG: DUF2283 domain-containing protein [Chloroflexi bacterium]|nr:DUF2283 domain-containing protein [Chloroflexota bacterium]
MRVYLEKDRVNDQIYIGLGERSLKQGVAKKTIRVDDNLAIDFDGRGRLVGIDIAKASRLLGKGVFREGLSIDDLVGVAEAAKLCGVKKPNFIRDFASKPDFPKPVVVLSSGRIWLRSDIETYLQSNGRLRRIA